MNWKSLTKQQKQVVILSAMLIFAALYGLAQFVIVPLMDSWKNSSAELAERQTELHQAKLTIRGEERIRQEFSEIEETLIAARDKFVPSLDDPLAWATQEVNSYARQVKVYIESISQVKVGVDPYGVNPKGEPVFGTYSVRVMTKCNYDKAIELAQLIEASNPFVVVGDLDIVGSATVAGGTPDLRHTVKLTLEWPIWLDEAGPDLIRTLDVENGESAKGDEG